MSESKKSPAKALSIIICIITLLVLAAAITVKALTGGQLRTAEKVYTAIERGNYSDYAACFAESAALMSEQEFDTLVSDYKEAYGEDYGIETRFASRSGISPLEADITVKITVHNDEKSNTESVPLHLLRIKGKWLIG